MKQTYGTKTARESNSSRALGIMKIWLWWFDTYQWIYFEYILKLKFIANVELDRKLSLEEWGPLGELVPILCLFCDILFSIKQKILEEITSCLFFFLQRQYPLGSSSNFGKNSHPETPESKRFPENSNT